MNNETEPINKERMPTPADLIILDWLQKGQSINNAEAISKFGNACLRDAIWRLGNAGHVIHREWYYYTNAAGKKKKFKKYYLVPPEILPAKSKTEKALKADGKDLVSISKNIQKIAAEQPILFPEYQSTLKSSPI